MLTHVVKFRPRGTIHIRNAFRHVGLKLEIIKLDHIYKRSTYRTVNTLRLL